MARTLQQLTIFVSGPSDVDSEKAALRVAVEEINRRSEKTHAVTLRVIGWPDDMRPGVSDDAQAEVNRQVGAEFDIYVGILGSRFGTPTARSGSGTEEEFARALSRLHADTTSVRVLFYFKRSEEDPFALDLEQLGRVRSFREQLSRKGVLYRDFRDTGEFTKLVREHLDSLIIEEWRTDTWTELSLPPAPEDVSSSAQPEPAPVDLRADSAEDTEYEEDSEPGILEYIAAYHDASIELVEVMAAITSETQRVGEEIAARSAETDRISEELIAQMGIGGSRVQQQSLGRTREAIDQAAANLEQFVSGMTPNVQKYKVLSRAMFDSMRGAFRMGGEVGSSDNTDNRLALSRLVPVIRESREHVMGFQTSVSRLPALTGRFRRSRKRAAAVLGELVAEMSVSIQNASALLEEMGGQPAGPPPQ